MTGLRIAIVEDEEIVARRLERLLGRVLGERRPEITRLSNLHDALDHLADHPIDLLFLDLDLRGEDGFRLLGEATAGSFHTIIVSARHDQALRAFEYGVVDFVAKPYTEERLRQAVGRVTNRESALREQLRYLAVRRAGEVRLVPVEIVVYVMAADDYCELHCEDGTSHLHGKTLTALAELLPPRFLRVHRSFLVDGSRVSALLSQPGSRYLLRLADGREIPVSRRRVQEVRALLV